jgi:hypothetical protein
MHEQLVVYEHGSTGIETVVAYEDGEMVSQWGREPVERMLSENQNLVLITFDDAAARIERVLAEKYGGPWTEVAEEKFWYMLEVLPPEAWKHFDGGEIFRMSEYDAGSYTGHYARVGSRYYHATRSVVESTTKHYEELVEQLRG